MSSGKTLARIAPAKLPARREEPGELAQASRSKWSARAPVVLGLAALVLLVGGFGGWASMTQISGAIIATGQIEVERNRQVVQHPDGGVVTRILVSEGDSVAAGDTLIRLDTVLLRTRLATAEGQFFELLSRKARLEAERDNVDTLEFQDLLLAADGADVDELTEGQRSLFQARLDTSEQLAAQLSGRRAQISRQVEGIVAQQAAMETQVALIKEELDDQQILLDQGLAQASRVLSLRREAARLQGQVGELLASAGEAAERISEIDVQLLTLDVQRREDAITELRDIQFQEVELQERVTGLREQLDRTEITAPVSGIVYGLTVFAERSVLRPADPVLFIVPQDRPLLIMVEVAPIHIDQVSVGQEVVLHFSTFDARTTPELFGEVMQISADSFQDDSGQISFYRAEIALKPGEIERLPPNRVLIPGMPVDAFLQTEDRTPLAYLVKPFTDYFIKAFRES